jgi:glycosyltransferase 2 family protein
MSELSDAKLNSAASRTGSRWFGSRFQIWLGLILALITVYLAARTVDLRGLLVALREARLPFIILTLIASLLTIILKGLRWRALFYPQRPRLSLLRLCDLIVIGQAINFYIPARLGEIVPAYLAGEEGEISKSYALGTIAAEKLIEIIMLAVLCVGLLPFLALPDWLSVRSWALLSAALAGGVLVIILLGGRRAIMQVVGWLLHWLPASLSDRWQSRISAGLEGLSGLGKRQTAVAVWGWTVAIWLMAALTNYLLLLAFDLPATPLIALFLLVVLQAGVAVPSTPGKIGVFHYLCMIALTVFGVSATLGLAYGLTLHALVIGGISIWAAIAMWRRSWSLRRLAQASQGTPAVL